MALTLNTNHPLYAHLKFLFAIDPTTSQPVDLITSNSTVFTVDAAASIVTGANGKALRTTGATNAPHGASFSPSQAHNSNTVGFGYTQFFVVEKFTGSTSNGSYAPELAAQTTSTGYIGAAAFNPTTDLLGLIVKQATNPSTLVYPASNVDLRDNAMHSVAVTTYNNAGTLEHKLYLDGALIVSATGGTKGTGAINYIGGGANRSVGADFVWVALFDTVATAQQIADLHTSIGANNAIALVEVPPTMTAVVAETGDSVDFLTSSPPTMLLDLVETGDSVDILTMSGISEMTLDIVETGDSVDIAITGDTSPPKIILPVLKNNSGQVLADLAGLTAFIYSVTTGDKLLAVAELTSDGAGVVTIIDTSAALTKGDYVFVVLTDGQSRGLERVMVL